MKNILSIIIAVFTLTGSVFAQGNFSGQITYELDYKGQGVEAFKSMLPGSYDYFFRDGDMLFRMNGGMAAAMMGDFVVFGKQGEAYMVKHAESTAYRMDSDADKGKEEVDNAGLKVEDTGETADILGYKCKKYKITLEDDEAKGTQYMWVTDKLNIAKPKGAGKVSSTGAMFSEKIKGFPLKVEMTMNQAGMVITMVMTATNIDDSKPEKSLFQIPDSYKIKEFNPAMFGF